MKIERHAIQPGLKAHPEIKNVILIASGKGGVGKSTTAVNVALALQQQGASVGLLDADIYGPNQPHLLGIEEEPEIIDKKIMNPIMAHNMQTMSVGYLIGTDTPMVWRGPMVSKMLQQLLFQTAWQGLDFLIVDMPPGTGDAQITISQKMPVAGAVIVTTPQDMALLDVRKGIEMFKKVKVPVLGVIENMAMHTCTQCGHQDAVFGTEGAEKIAASYDLPVLGQLPLSAAIRAQADSGVPSVVAEPSGDIAQAYQDIAKQLLGRLSLRPKDYSHHFQHITKE